jgi:signal transduction histidine kinase
LLIDISLTNTRANLLKDLRTDLVVSAGFTLIISAGVYLFVHWLVVRRVEQFSDPLAAIASGDFKARLPSRLKPRDEIDVLANAVNLMADELAGHIKAQEERHLLRHNAIVEERERIAREIHDGVAQLLGYVNTKVAAIRVLLKNREFESAQSQLEQLATASHESFTELRTDILGLRTSDTNSAGLVSTLETFVDRFNQLTGIRIDVNLPQDDSAYQLPSESELQLLRIAQEALSNIQKHASSDHGWVQLKVFDHTLELTIGDNGLGFDPIQPRSDHRPHFGLSTMRERAESIGATFEVKSEPGEGTQVIVLVPLENE